MTILSTAHTVLEKNMNKNRIISVSKAKKLFLTTSGISMSRGKTTDDLILDLQAWDLVEVCDNKLKVLEW